MIAGRTSTESVSGALLSLFQELFGTGAEIFRAPGRVNLIGEHTDYNDGFVLPMAIGFYTWVAAAKRGDRALEAYSEHFDERVCLPLDALSGPPRKHWTDFLRGVAATLQEAGVPVPGANLVIHGGVPLGAGLSSSASLELAVGLALTSLGGEAISRFDLAKLCQAAEHKFVGTRCGIMDQFVATFGIAGSALILDCRSLEYKVVAIPKDFCFVVCNSMVRHELVSGEYNLRRAECETGVRVLQRVLPAIRALRDVEMAELEKHKELLSETVYRRCRHVISENQRVLLAANALEKSDAEHFGDLMYRSHANLRDDFQVSCEELDLLVDLAASSPGVYGARMTGGGFGGCTVNLMKEESVSAFRTEIARLYQEKTGITPEIYICRPANGAEAWPAEPKA